MKGDPLKRIKCSCFRVRFRLIIKLYQYQSRSITLTVRFCSPCPFNGPNPPICRRNLQVQEDITPWLRRARLEIVGASTLFWGGLSLVFGIYTWATDKAMTSTAPRAALGLLRWIHLRPTLNAQLLHDTSSFHVTE